MAITLLWRNTLPHPLLGTLFLLCLPAFLPPGLCRGESFPNREQAEMFDRLLPTQAPPQEQYSPTRGVAGAAPVARSPHLVMHLRFDLDSARLKPEALGPLANLSAVLGMEKLRGYVYRIEGHTCDLGTEAHNQDLSLRRARAVVDDLVRRGGLPPGQFEITGFGESRPAVANTDEAARKQNRRVVIINTLKKFEYGAAARSGIVTQVKYLLRDGKRSAERILESGKTTLTAQDNYCVEFRADRPAHLYVYQIDSEGAISALFPNPAFSAGSNPVTPGRYYRVPGGENWLYLDNRAGTERIVVIADSRPIPDPEAVCMAVIREPGGDTATPLYMAETRGVKGMRKAGEQRGLKGIREEAAPAPATPPAPKPAAGAGRPEYVWVGTFQHR